MMSDDNSSKRSLGMLKGDNFLNNTEYDLSITDENGKQVAVVETGCVFEAPHNMTVTFDVNTGYTFRAYLNAGYRRN